MVFLRDTGSRLNLAAQSQCARFCVLRLPLQFQLSILFVVWDRILSAIRRVSVVIIGDRLREIRQKKKMSQGDIEQRTGLHRCYISRVENGYTVPAIETLEKMARALEIPMYQLFYDGENPPELANLPKHTSPRHIEWGGTGKDARWMSVLRHNLGRLTESDRKLVMFMVLKMARARANGSKAG